MVSDLGLAWAAGAGVHGLFSQKCHIPTSLHKLKGGHQKKIFIPFRLRKLLAVIGHLETVAQVEFQLELAIHPMTSFSINENVLYIDGY